MRVIFQESQTASANLSLAVQLRKWGLVWQNYFATKRKEGVDCHSTHEQQEMDGRLGFAAKVTQEQLESMK